ncbi:MAG TPA: STM3941 family protein [Herpetosiphonaceae bacterium]|nr:STM3941 family protein [Herpetosiphonaceae bacterium]
MERIIINNSRVRFILLTVLSLAFVGIGVMLVTSASASRAGNTWKGWLAIVFFGACAAVGAWQLFDRRPRLVIDDEGVFDRTLKVGRIPWSAIAGATPQSILGNHFIALDLRNEEEWIARLPKPYRSMVKGNEALGFAKLNLNLSGTDAKPAELLALIQYKCAQHGPPGTPRVGPLI